MSEATPFNLDSIAAFEGKARADWDYLVAKGLKGADPSTLIRKTEDGLTRGPLTTLNDRPIAPAAIMRSGVPRLDGRDWHICAPVLDGSLAQANTQLLADLEGGASAARITLSGGGVQITRAADLERLLDKVHASLIPFSFTDAAMTQVDAIFETSALQSAHVTLGLDVIENSGVLDGVISRCPQTWRALTLRPSKIHEVGGTDVQELAAMAGLAVLAMNTLGAEKAHRHITIEIAVDRDAHLTIAKVRAARRLYARIAESYGLSDTSVPLFAITSQRMMQSLDPWTNMLRVMSAAFGAVTGGADYITLLPFTASGEPRTKFGHRIARNMQLMMMEESRLGAVADPAHGSYFHERMSDQLAQAAWAKFQTIEASGGIRAYLDYELQSDILSAIGARAKIADPIIGKKSDADKKAGNA